MIVTDSLAPDAWDQIGWQDMETVEDMAHACVYFQHTADGRIALGGRGVPYRYASGVDTDGTAQPRTIAALTQILAEFFPAMVVADDGRVPVAHAWSGVLGVPRGWPTVTYDLSTGLGGRAGGYV